MGYNEGADLLLQRVRSLDEYGASNASDMDWTIITSGDSDHYAVIKPGAFQLSQMTMNEYMIEWISFIEVWVLYTDEVQSYSDLARYTVALFEILAYPNLGDSSVVLQATITASDDPEEMFQERGGLEYLRWTITVNWKETKVITFQE